MANPYQIDNHPQRQQIIDSILAGKSLRDIAEKTNPPLSYGAIHRYRHNVIRPGLRAAAMVTQAKESICSTNSGNRSTTVHEVDTLAVTRAALRADPILARVAHHQQTLDAAILDARGDQDARGVAALIGTDLKGLELTARLTGLLDGPQSATSVSISIMLPPALAVPDARPEPSCGPDAIDAEIVE